MQRKYTTLADRLWAKVEKTDGCWNWLGATNGRGYGRIYCASHQPRNAYTHRVAYELLVGAIPDGMQIDHLCRNTLCCNPAHLEPVSSKTNSLRGLNRNFVAHREQHCTHGHHLTPENTYMVRDGHGVIRKHCKSCKRASDARHYQAKKETVKLKARLRYHVTKKTGHRKGYLPDPVSYYSASVSQSHGSGSE